jgi:hypothetical protein
MADAATKLKKRLARSRPCRNCTSTIPSLSKVAQQLRTLTPGLLELAQARTDISEPWAFTIGQLEELLPDVAAQVLGFCHRYCEGAYSRRHGSTVQDRGEASNG